MYLNGPSLVKSVMPSKQLFAPELSGLVLEPEEPALPLVLEPALPLVLEPALPLLLLVPLPAAAIMPVVVVVLVGVVVVLVEPVGVVVVVDEPVAPLPALPVVELEVGGVVVPLMPALPDAGGVVVLTGGAPVLGCPLVVVSLPPQPRANRHGAANISDITEALRVFACFMTISIFPAYPDVWPEGDTIAIRLDRHRPPLPPACRNCACNASDLSGPNCIFSDSSGSFAFLLCNRVSSAQSSARTRAFRR